VIKVRLSKKSWAGATDLPKRGNNCIIDGLGRRDPSGKRIEDAVTAPRIHRNAPVEATVSGLNCGTSPCGHRVGRQVLLAAEISRIAQEC